MFQAWSSPERVFALLSEISRGQPCDFSAIRDYPMIDRCGGIQWPCRAQDLQAADGAPEPERRLFADGLFFTPDRRARFLYDPPRAMPERPDAAFPLLLLTGRGTSSQWHTNTRTAKSSVLRKLYPASCYVEISPADAARLGITAHGRVRVSSRRGQVTAGAFVTPTVREGTVFIPMHYREANQLTRSAFDLHSRQPSYKACAVRVEALGDAAA